MNRIRHLKKVSQLVFSSGKVLPSSATAGACESHKLLEKYGYIHSVYPGGYAFLPLAQRVYSKLIALIDEEMENIGADKITLPNLIPVDLWKQTGRWEASASGLFRLSDRKGKDLCLGPTHEESITSMVSRVFPELSSRSLPLKLYQIGRKFRDEISHRNGLLRAREFDMKDLYTFSADHECAMNIYKEVSHAYGMLFYRLGLKYCCVEASSGDIGGPLSHEFHLLADVGEDSLVVCEPCGVGFNREVLPADQSTASAAPGLPDCANCGQQMTERRGVEAGHCFLLADRYSSALQAHCRTPGNVVKPMVMGCYGLGVGRLMAAAVEVLGTREGIRWPAAIAPYLVAIIPQTKGHRSDETYALAERLGGKLLAMDHLAGEVLLDDRLRYSIGRRARELRAMGLPYLVAVGKRALDWAEFEFIDVAQGTTEYLSENGLLTKLKVKTLFLSN